MKFDDCLRAELAKGNPPMVALHNAATLFADFSAMQLALMARRKDSSQYADETAAWSEPEEIKPHNIEAVTQVSDERSE